jgi:hypothetical protein
MSAPTCRDCSHFRNHPAFLEAAFAGLSSLGSAYGSVRDEDGLCLRHERYLSARCGCADFAARSADRRQPAEGKGS